MIQRSLIVGAHFRPPAKGLITCLPFGTKLIARREASNAYDTNAIQVIWPTAGCDAQNGTGVSRDTVQSAVEGYGSSADEVFAQPEWHLGYIPRTEAANIAPLMDRAGVSELAGELTFAATGGAQIQFAIPD
jgi:hypothetical protein